ncbi:hypothetical protein SpCBS45565_g04314 [Spizellomyces sp. 'palustris']|nr:hypothetical protein SpCBS45565_g04314 [Spizellomyces sp. 'palustris']
MSSAENKANGASTAVPPVTLTRKRSLKEKDRAAKALANGPFLETATTVEGKLVTRVSPPGTPNDRKDEVPPPEAGIRKWGRDTRPRKNSFTPRPSPLDWDMLEKTKNPLRGFFTLFWMTMAYSMASSLYLNWRKNGQPVGRALFATMFSEGFWVLLYSEMVLIASLFSVVIIEKLFIAGWLPRSLTRVVQHLYQTAWFFFCLYWVFHNDWTWTQSGFFTLHSISMLMKQHSYMAYNNEMLYRNAKFMECENRMDKIAGKMKKLGDDAPELEALNIEWEKLRRKAQDLQVELCKGNTKFPENVTFLNFVDYLLVPSLVYELEYPRTDRIRPWYVFEKGIGVIGIIMILYVTVENYIYPVLNRIDTLTFFESVTHLILPFMVCYMLLFYLIFECICNWFAEITRFADREFYDDWWNSVTFDEYARKWNKPVHEFLLRHVYLESISTYKLSKQNATFLTFFLSSCLHELVMYVLAKRVRMYLFTMQMIQIPLIILSRWSKLKKYPRIGNAFFWWGIYLGPPLLAVMYCREFWSAAQA